MLLAILFHFLCAQHVSDINISIIRSLRLCCLITTWRFVLSSLCVGDLLRLGLSSVRVVDFSLQNGHYSNPAAPNLQHTTNQEQNDMW